MSDTTPDEPPQPETVPVTVNVPVGLLASYERDVERGLYATRESALLHGLVESARHHGGRYSTLRVDLLRPTDQRPDTPHDDDSVDDALAAVDAVQDPETGETGAGEGEGGEREP
jgi:hypothetical protein